MRRGCIAVGEVKCEGCHRLIDHGERYLLIEEDGTETLRFCLDCCLSKKYATHVTEKGEEVLTFFPIGHND